MTFGRVLREAGLEVGAGRLADALRGLDRVDLTRQDDVYWTLRTTLVARREELEPFDRAFRAWFLRAPVAAPPRREDPRRMPRSAQRVRRDARPGADAATAEGEPDSIGASPHEVLRRKDFGAMTGEELAAGPPSDRRARRSSARAGARGGCARTGAGRRSTCAAWRAARWPPAATPSSAASAAAHETPRKLVVLCDVSGSMEAYSRAMLLFLHALVRSGRGVEVFAFGTRLTRLTGELATRDPEEALRRAADRVVDWAAGTRIGASLKAFNDVWGRRALARGAVVLIVSDGWERQDNALVGREMQRLHRGAYAVVWANPLRGSAEYEPLAGGMRAALPYVDRFVAGHDLASLEELAALLSGIERRHVA